jgi:Glycosyl hydrolases family 2, TIM barrel domain/Glycosyl hydrolases family 2/Glycosyl hydrolases family 2, sugar binding domain
MDRRRFVQTLGSSTLSSTWALGLWGKPNVLLPQSAAPGEANGGALWPPPVLVPLPKEVAGVHQPVIDLAGIWKVTTAPPAEFWANKTDSSHWSDVKVPGELTAQDILFARDSEFAYKRSIVIPAEAVSKAVVLRFEGVYSHARVWVNGNLVREHDGGFTAWDCEITPYIVAGKTAWLTVGVTDRSDDISYASNYAKHYVGGILRGVKLLILPAAHLTRLHAETDFDSSFRDARLKVMAGVTGHGGHGVRVNLHLTDPQGTSVYLTPNSLAFAEDQPEAPLEIPVASPLKWDAEHPHLYTLRAELVIDNNAVEKVERQIGFRKVERRGNKLYVNVDPVKLRGVCRHDTHPLLGRVSTPQQDEKDAMLLRDANVNFVRTSHYPPAETFLDACDRYGIYVEEESAVCFVSADWAVAGAGSQSDPEFTARYMNQFAEMIERDRSHPCVIFWSLGNESTWGSNFQLEHDYAKQQDPTRPVIFSFPNTVPAGVNGFDILSDHYPNFDADLTSRDIPKLNDEYAHVSCYNHETLERDPGVRNFWGEGFKRLWENCYTADGCQGGAIWAGFDEVFMLPSGPVGYGEWGIIDGWRRPKPEYWLTKKAYSPVRIADGDDLPSPDAGQPLDVPVKNWFNHTNLAELQTVWTVRGETGHINNLNVAPGMEGVIAIPPRVWRDGDVLNLKFFRPLASAPIDEFSWRIGKRTTSFPGESGPAPKIAEDALSLKVQGPDFSIVFTKVTGLIAHGTYRGQRILEGGPFLNLGSLALDSWWLNTVRHSSTPEAAVVHLDGAHMNRAGGGDVLRVEFEIRIDGQGLITTRYVIHGQPKGMSEVGIAYILSSAMDRLVWNRKAVLSGYPADHIGRPMGTATRGPHGPAEAYRQEPKGPWSDDTTDYFLYGPGDQGGRGANDFRSLKENIWHASCIMSGTNLQVRAESDGTAAVRAEVLADGKVRFNINNLWGYPDLAWGNYLQPVNIGPGYTNQIRVSLTDAT